VELAEPKVEPTYIPTKEKSLQKVVELLDRPKQSSYGQKGEGPAGPPSFQ
jgi:hypothetical protein